MRQLLALMALCLVSGLLHADDWVEVRKEALSETLRLDGVIEAVRESTVSAQTTGTVTKLPYDVDDRVDAGDLIIQLEDSEQRSRLNQAESALEEAEAGLEDARQNFERVQSLYERDVATQSDLDQARNRLNGAEARVNRTEAEVAEAQQQLDYTRVKAPYSGIVTERMVELGESVMMGQPLMRGLSLEQLRVVVSLPQQYANRVRRERNATVTLDDGRRLETGEMTFYPYADEATHSFRLRLRLNEPQGQLFPGMLVRVGIPLDTREALWVPQSSLYRRGELRAVFVKGEEGEPRLRQVRVGVSRDGRLEILSGLSGDEQVLREAADR
ncbi:RND family efflux transporter MFP subunit [Halospina denitrificans]|uniref:RND family efflux transporter MFP subunit n=1 Tax=Halospina denitrificans TaxID=332522 RepID=A0A4R7K0Q4_9GAMM|nr:efflux RND transporter periplasmic adaptor subunit [Halospina denitrificans]TDT44371.1 RND family efflux transporter MFP subunit [Halospina denitrificans]